MTNKVSNKYLLIVLLAIFIFFGCARDNPETITNPPNIQKIYPINIYTLTLQNHQGLLIILKIIL